MSKVGIFGGAFDPIHSGHVEMAVLAKKELKLSEMLIIPTANPPFGKKCSAPFSDRAEMAGLAFEGIDGFAVSDIEKKISGKSYTINTLRALKEIYPQGTDFWLIIGGDQLFEIERWFRYEAILKECHVAAVTRDGVSYADMQEYANELGRVRVLNLPIPAVSSTEVREKLLNGESTAGLIPDAVAKYIGDRGLYRG